MEIKQDSQYNQAISRYKLLSSNAGVASIVTTITGNYVLISDIAQWPFIRSSNNQIRELRESSVMPENWYSEAKRNIRNSIGIDLVDDERFINFLRIGKQLPNLLCLAAIPQLSLNENFNSLSKEGNPAIKRLSDQGIEKQPKDFTIPATHFPKWFRNEKGILQTLEKWKLEWQKANRSLRLFAPPRDVKDLYPYKIKIKKDNKIIEEDFCKVLTQTNLILICENGHLSDIPWSKFLRWKSSQKGGRNQAKGTVLFTTQADCCDNPLLKWTENKNRSEGYASIYIECSSCGHGSGRDGKPKVSLEGINNLEPLCPGHKPWEISLEGSQSNIPFDTECCGSSGQRSTMKVALATGNNVYFANTFSSIYIPSTLLKGITKELDHLLKICEIKYAALSDPNKSKDRWAEKRIDEEFLDEYSGRFDDNQEAISKLKEVFINGGDALSYENVDDLQEVYRQEEYNVFCKNEVYKSDDGLMFYNTKVDKSLVPYFNSIKKVEELKVTSVQLDFSRVSPKEHVRAGGNVVESESMNIFSNVPEDVFILPAVENFGEGIFFEFNEDALLKWTEVNDRELSDRLSRLLPTGGSFNGNSLRNRIQRDKSKLLAVHTFSHLIMRELEFSCGYPTASLKERLYISPEMSGVLIYTSEGSEGSMGGLIWQAEQSRMAKLVASALERALGCSSDPLCWEDEGQGLFNMNLASCFSCSLVSETACEERNVMLDRRVLVDAEFGFFKELVKI